MSIPCALNLPPTPFFATPVSYLIFVFILYSWKGFRALHLFMSSDTVQGLLSNVTMVSHEFSNFLLKLASPRSFFLCHCHLSIEQ